MKNEKGDITLFCIASLLVLSALLLLCTLELQKSFKTLESRTHLFLCVKETKEEINRYLHFMGQTNWAIKNIHRTSLVMMVIPGLQGASFEAEKVKKTIMTLQELKLISYLKTINSLRNKNCPLDPRIIITPFILSAGLERDSHKRAKLRNTKWTYYFLRRPYVLTMEVDAGQIESLRPKVLFKTQEKGGTLSSLLSSHF